MAVRNLRFILSGSDKSASRSLDRVGSKADRLSSKLAGVGKSAALGLAGGVAAAGAGVAATLASSISAASDLGETLSKVNNVFGANAKDIRAWSKDSARSFGISQQAALAAAGQYGDMFIQLGFTREEAVKNSKSVVQLAADLGSFHNAEPTDVLERIGGALRGEFDSLQALIPNINAARVETEALRQTGKKSAKDLNAQEKAAATLAIVMKDSANAAGDFSETSDGLANQQRILKAQIQDTKARIGQGLLPIMAKLAKFANDEVVPAIQRFVDQFQRGVGPGGEFRQTVADFGQAAKDAWPEIKNAFEKTKTIVDFVIEHKEAFFRIAEGVAAYKLAMVGVNFASMATGIASVGAASGGAAPKVDSLGAAAVRNAGPIAALAAAIFELDRAGKLDFSSFGKGGDLDRLIRAAQDGDKGGMWDALWGEGFSTAGGPLATWEDRKDKRAIEQHKSTPPRGGGSSQDRVTPLNPTTRTYRDQRTAGSLLAPVAVMDGKKVTTQVSSTRQRAMSRGLIPAY